MASFPHTYSNGISMFLKYENVDEYWAGVGFHFVKMILYLTKYDTHIRAQWECQNENFETGHLFSIVKLNFNVGLFSCIFFIWDHLP